MGEELKISELFTLALEFAVIMGNPKKEVFRKLKMKNANMKVDTNISVEAFKNRCDQFQKQRNESFEEVYKLYAFEQRVFLATGYIDRNFMTRFRGIDISDILTVRKIASKARYQYSMVDVKEYDERRLFEYFWAIAMSYRRSMCVAGSVDQIINTVTSKEPIAKNSVIIKPDFRIFPAKLYYQKQNWLIGNGMNIALF